MQIEVSFGELLDKVTILEIKRTKIQEPEKLNNVEKEWEYLLSKIPQEMKDDKQFATFVSKLYHVNLELWDIEDGKRNHERNKDFNDDFIQLARQVYIKNDLRAQIKREINIHFKSTFVEEKSYKVY